MRNSFPLGKINKTITETINEVTLTTIKLRQFSGIIGLEYKIEDEECNIISIIQFFYIIIKYIKKLNFSNKIIIIIINMPEKYIVLSESNHYGWVGGFTTLAEAKKMLKI